MRAIHLVHRLLFHALLEMREAGRENRNKVVYQLADLFHNVILEMEQAADGGADYDQVLAFLEERAAAKGCDQWVKNRIQQLCDNTARQHPEPENRS